MKISVVIPVYNEVDSLRELHHQLTQSLSPFESYEILFIDDGSSDGSVDLIKRMSETDDHINLIQFHRNYGKSAALAEGFKYAEGEYIVTMDADLQDDPILLPWMQIYRMIRRKFQTLSESWRRVLTLYQDGKKTEKIQSQKQFRLSYLIL